MKNRKLSFRSNPAYGFSVVELIVALTIMTIIVTVGFSAYTYFQIDYGKVAKNEKNESERYDQIKTNVYKNIVTSNPTSICGGPNINLNVDSLNECIKAQPQNF